MADHCSYGYTYLYRTHPEETFDLAVPGARAENNRWRGKEHDFYRDVRVKAVLFDQILTSLNLSRHVTEVGILNLTEAVKGDRTRIRFDESGNLVYTRWGTFASDHVPVWAKLRF